MPFYDDSLSLLVGVLHENAVDLESIAVVRDGVGRLLVAAPELAESSKIQAAIRDALQAYASPLTVVTGEPAKRLLADSHRDERTVTLDGTDHIVRYFDRRIVGADWLSDPAVANDQAVPRLVFGSLKGGVGRSTAMAVLAADLAAAGKRVLAIDLDIEAPGIGFMLLPAAEDPAQDRRPQFGSVDYLVEHGLGGVPSDRLIDFVGTSPFGHGFAEVVPAVGRSTDDEPHMMMEKLSRALVEDVKGSRRRVIDQVQDLVEAFAQRTQYDAILIDSRAGLGEVSAAPLLGLNAEILLFATDQPQTFRGYRYLLAHMRQHLPMSDGGDWRQKLHFVQAKAPSAGSKRATFRANLYELCAEFLYDAESLASDGRVIQGSFNPAPSEGGVGVPHDATFIEYHPNYDAFDPSADPTQLSEEVYRGPYDAFLSSAWALLGLNRSENNATTQ